MKFTRITTACLIAICGLLAGCDSELQQSNSGQGSTESTDSHSHAHPNLSLHKPKELTAAIQRISQMHDSLIGEGDFPAPVAMEYVEVIHGQGAAGHSHFYSAAEFEENEGEDHDDHHHEEDETVKRHTTEIDLRTELTDVARWLPGIAAKSNLNETDWNSVKTISGRFGEIIGGIPADSTDDSFRESWQQKSKEIEGLLKELRTFVKSGAAK